MSRNLGLPKTGMILAAGFGARLRSVLGDKPKPLVGVSDSVTALDVAIDSFLKIEAIKEIVINIHYEGHQIKEHLAKYLDTPKPIIISEEEEILETGGGILNAMRECGSSNPFVIRNADAIFIDAQYNILQFLLNAWDDSVMDALLLLAPKELALGRAGDFYLAEDGRIVRAQYENDLIYTGFSVISPRMFHGCDVRKFSLSEILFRSTQDAYRSCKFFGITIPITTSWYDIGTPESLFKAREHLNLVKDVGLQ